MFIYHFNRLIRNRILWGFFAILIAFAFVAVDSCFRRPDGPHSAGSINGKKISLAQFDETVRAIRGHGSTRDSESSAAVIDRRAWEQIAAAVLAKKIGLGTSPEEIRAMLAEQQAFQGPNGFDINRYRMLLAQQGLTPEMYERLLEQQISLMKLSTLADSASWIAPMELDDELTAMTDRFTVQAATISNQFATLDMQLSDEKLRKYYEDHKDSFALPDRVAVNYAAFPVTNYLPFVTVAEDDLLDYYDSNINEYTRAVTNATAESAAATADSAEATAITENIPFAEVRDKIMEELKLVEARNCASTAVTFRVYGKLAQTEDDSLAIAAKEAGVMVKKSPLFAVDDQIFWAESGDKLATMAFELDEERDDQRYGVVESDNFIYAFSIAERSAAHTPTFEAVLAKLKPRALAQARSDAFEEQVTDLRTSIQKLMEEGKSFAEIAKSKAMNVTTSLTYSVNEINQESFSNAFSIAYGAMRLNKGELSEAVPASTTQSLLIYVQEREPGDALAAEMMRAQLHAGIARRNRHNLFDEWLEWNLTQQDFQPTQPLLHPDATPEIDEP